MLFVNGGLKRTWAPYLLLPVLGMGHSSAQELWPIFVDKISGLEIHSFELWVILLA